MKLQLLILIAIGLINGQFLKTNQLLFNTCNGYEYLRPDIFYSKGKATITVDPTQAVITLVIENKQSTASQALDEVSIISDKALKAIKDNAKGELKIQTQSFTVNPYQDFDYYISPPKLISSGFSVANTLSIETHNVDEVGKIIDLAVKNGVNQISNVVFTISPQEKQRLQNMMIDMAIQDAKHQAQITLKELDMEIHSIKYISQPTNHEEFGTTFTSEIQVGFIIVPHSIDQ